MRLRRLKRDGIGADAADTQLAGLSRVADLLQRGGCEYWVFGGWAVDLHAGSVTRAHDDIDIAVWAHDHEEITALLAADGWRRAPVEGEDGFTSYERDGVRLEVAFLARDADGAVYTPLRTGRGTWPDGSFEDEVGEVDGLRARVVGLRALAADKSETRHDPSVAAKDAVDLRTLSALLKI